MNPHKYFDNLEDENNSNGLYNELEAIDKDDGPENKAQLASRVCFTIFELLWYRNVPHLKLYRFQTNPPFLQEKWKMNSRRLP